MDLAYAAAIAVISFLCGLGLSMLRTYTGEKAKNLATKEDLEELTEIVENIKDGNARGLTKLTEELRAHYSMRSAALEKRLEVHQDAYRLSMRMLQTVFAAEADHLDVGNEIRDWWMRNSLYLDKDPRAAFDKAWMAFVRHPTIMRAEVRVPAEDVIKNFDEIRALPRVLEDAMALPAIKLDLSDQIGANVPEELADKANH
ncbi:hypothetical protein [Luteibacter sp. 3190]|uniref:hypothetical protein n=1 Tax=Luteibacter sp. 3190 TaxID=2817736 RepID=UPI00286D452A|nr:hypothetical protein [Luteibacter sp. 3190]